MSAPQTPRGATPGPWIFNEARSSHGLLAITTADETQNVAQVFGLPLGEVGHANAALIASAPDLLAERDALIVQVAALKAALAAALNQCARSNEPEALRAADLLRAALAEVAS